MLATMSPRCASPTMHRAMVVVALVVVAMAQELYASSVLHGDLRYLYYGEVPLGHLNDGRHRRRLVPVPDEERDTGANIVDPQALEETPDVVLDVVDRTLIRVSVELKRPHASAKFRRLRQATLLPFRILISDGGDDETAEEAQHVVLNARSNHGIHEDVAMFHLAVPLFLIDPHALFFIRLDTYSRRSTRFESAFWLPMDLPRLLNVRGQDDDTLRFMVIPKNASFGTRFECDLGIEAASGGGHRNNETSSSNDSTRFRLRVVALRKPPVPPQRVWVDLIEVPSDGRPQRKDDASVDAVMEHSKEETRALLAMLEVVEHRTLPMRRLAVASSGAPTARGLVVEDAFALPSTAPMTSSGLRPRPELHPPASDSYRFMVRITTEFEELTRQFRETFVLSDATNTVKALRVADKSERLMLPLSFLAKLRHAQAHRKELLRVVRDEHYIKLKLQYASEQASLSLFVLQPFPIKNLQVFVVDGRNATIFVEEEYDVPYVGPHDAASQVPFGWRRVVDDTVTWFSGDTVSFHVFYDLRDPPLTESQHTGLAALWEAASECGDDDEIGVAQPALRLGGVSLTAEATGNVDEHDAAVPLSFRMAANGLAVRHHHAVRDRFETLRGHELLWSWLERYDGFVHPMLHIGTLPRVLSGPFLTLSSNVTSADTWPNADTELLTIAADVILSIDTVRTVSFVHLLFASEAWGDLRNAWSQPDRADLRTRRGTLDMYASDRTEQVLMLTLFSLTQAEQLVTGVRFHAWLKTLPNHRTAAGLQACYPMLHAHSLAAAFKAHGLGYFATVLRQRRAFLEAVYDLLEDTWPWLVPKFVSLDMFMLRYSLIEAMALEGGRGADSSGRSDGHSDRIVYVAPTLSWCMHSSTPTAVVAYNASRRMLVVSVAASITDASLSSQCRAMQAEGLLVDDASRRRRKDANEDALCRRAVTCDWAVGYHEGSKSMGRLTTLECLLRRGVVYGVAEGVVDVTVHYDPHTAAVVSPQPWFANRTFLLTRELRSRDAILEFVAYAVCGGGRVVPKRRYVATPSPRIASTRAPSTAAVDADTCAKRHLQQLLQQRKWEVAVVVSGRSSSTTAPAEGGVTTTCSHTTTVANMLVGAHRVIAVHLHALQHEADADPLVTQSVRPDL